MSSCVQTESEANFIGRANIYKVNGEAQVVQ